MKRILVILLFSCFALTLSAQYKDSPIHFAILGSGHMNWIFTDADKITGGEPGIGADTEFHIDYFFHKNFAFSTGVNWSFTGGHMTFTDTLPVSFVSGYKRLVPQTRLSYHLQFVEIPLGIKIASREIGYTTLFVDFGLRPMFRIKATGNTDDGVHWKDPIFKEVAKFNLSHQTEVGVKYSFGNKTSLIFSAFYKNTFLDFTTDYLDKPNDNSRINQAGLKLGFGF